MEKLDPQSISDIPQSASLREFWNGKKVCVLGADGFIGSYTALALHFLGAELTIVSRRIKPLLHELGARTFRGDLNHPETFSQAVHGQEFVFDLAGASSGVDSNINAAVNSEKECTPHLNLFRTAAEQEKPPVVFFCSSRTVYGKAEYTPVDEMHPTEPQSIYAVHKLTLENYLKVLYRTHNLPFVVLRLSNPYGPFPWQQGKAYGILNQFIHTAYKGGNLTLFGDGNQIRDYIHIQDVVSAILKTTSNSQCHQKIFNLGGPEPISMGEAVKTIVAKCPSAKIEHKTWPRDYLSVETGDYYSDCRALEETVGWKPEITFNEGLERTLKSYTEADKMLEFDASRTEQNAFSEAQPTINWSSKRVLVTGASGSLGNFVSKMLLALGAEVIGLYRSKEPNFGKYSNRAKAYHVDLSDSATRIQDIFEETQPNFVMHLAAKPDGHDDYASILDRFNSNTTATIHLLQAAYQVGVEAFIMGGSCKVYGNSPAPHREHTPASPDSSYASSKFAAWSMCRVFNKTRQLPVAAIHPTLIYGPGQGFNLFSFLANSAKSGKDVVQLDGGLQSRDPVFIADAARAYILAAENIRTVSGRALPLSGGKEISVANLSRKFAQFTQTDMRIEPCPDRMRPTEMMRSYCINDEAEKLISWTPQVDLDKGLSATAQFLLCSDSEIRDAMVDHCVEEAAALLRVPSMAKTQ